MTELHSSAHVGQSSLYGFNLLQLIDGYEKYRTSAYELAEFVATHGRRYPIDQVVDVLGTVDKAAFDVLREQRAIAALDALPNDRNGSFFTLSINTLGRLHIRPSNQALPVYSDEDQWIEAGYVELSVDLIDEINRRAAAAVSREEAAFLDVKRTIDRLHASGDLERVVEEVTDHVEHVESVCFYVNDRLFALIDRYVNLIGTKGGKGFLSALKGKPYEAWSREETIIVAALHALFIAGRAVKFEEFNGTVLSAHALLGKLHSLLDGYASIGAQIDPVQGGDIFDIAAEIRKQSLNSVGQPWLRYRSIYGLTFQKHERILRSSACDESPEIHLKEFGEDYKELTGGRNESRVPEHLFFAQLAGACLARDAIGITCDRGSAATTGWIEYLIEKIVASAVIATDSDYGMSSSLRNIPKIVEYDQSALLSYVHELTPADFYTCFVSMGFASAYEKSVADVIASSVQKRMMFNRWHFFPGNFDRPLIQSSRHWYYPPLVPDIAAHSNMHRAAHARAQVKYSIRSPGPDMSRPPLAIANQKYRGFYDVRVVRMDGDKEYVPMDMLKTRRRTQWLEALYSVLVSHLQSVSPPQFRIEGFQPGVYLDLSPAGLHPGNVAEHGEAELLA